MKWFGFGKGDLSEDITNTTLVIENPVKARVVELGGANLSWTSIWIASELIAILGTWIVGT